MSEKEKEGLVRKAVNAIIRPPRSTYDDNALPLVLDAGDNHNYNRFPVYLQNERGQRLVGSIYYESKYNPLNGGPCVMYLHGNASSQLEGQFLVPNFCPYGIFVFCFDFAGCGLSDGDYVSLGYFESQDVNFLIRTLHKQFAMGPFVLWGRSMGAATTLIVDNPYVIAKISDSAFTSVPDMCAAIAKSMSLPSFFIPMVIWFLKKMVLKTAEFDIESISPLNCQQECPVPCVFGHAENDKFIPFEQCRELYNRYGNPMKHIMMLEGGHNSKRDIGWITLGVTFALDMLSIPADNIQISECRKLQSASHHFGSFETMLNSSRETNEDLVNEFKKSQEIVRQRSLPPDVELEPESEPEKEKEKVEEIEVEVKEHEHEHRHKKDKDKERERREKKKERREKRSKEEDSEKRDKKDRRSKDDDSEKKDKKEKKHKKDMTPEEKAERKRLMEERHARNELKRAKKRAKEEKKAKKEAKLKAKAEAEAQSNESQPSNDIDLIQFESNSQTQSTSQCTNQAADNELIKFDDGEQPKAPEPVKQPSPQPTKVEYVDFTPKPAKPASLFDQIIKKVEQSKKPESPQKGPQPPPKESEYSDYYYYSDEN